MPCRRERRSGASVVRHDAAMNRMEDLNVKACKEAITSKIGAISQNREASDSDRDDPKAMKPNPNSKQSRVIAMLQSSSGATIIAMMKATGWQKHSVRGFLAGVVRKRLKLKLESTKAGDDRIYRIVGKSDHNSNTADPKRKAA